ncbi:MAG: 4Fe-4S binding protein [Elusimicrobia bacterium]|nr:4Fe-4S binding protein [Elusimicrobiota bacterium]
MPFLEGDPKSFPRVIISDGSMADNHTGNWRTMRPVIHAESCTGCQICWKYCPEACVRLTDKVPIIGMDYCKGCGICVEECPAGCVEFLAEATP